MNGIKFKNKFTKSRHPLKKSLRINLSNWILESVAKLPKFQGGLVHSLQTIDEHRKREVFSVAKPDDVDLEFLHIWIFETFLIGDIDELKQGLQNLFSDFSKTRYIIPFKTKTEDIDNTFKGIGNSLLSLSQHRIGLIDVLGNTEKLRSKRTWIENFHVSVHHFSQSFVTVSFGVEPTPLFKQIVHDVLLDETPARIDFILPKSLKHLKLWSTFPGYSQMFSVHVKRECIENLMLEFKYEATNIISQYLRGIFIRNGSPIPSIELFCKKSSRNQRTGNHQSEVVGKKCLFWDSVGMSKRSLDYFENEKEGLSIFLSNYYEKETIDKPFKLLLEKAKANLKSDADAINDRLIHETEYYLETLSPILIVQ
ncbi:MAG: hypothetical protein AB1499_09410 [Nitrospirota bacterium]